MKGVWRIIRIILVFFVSLFVVSLIWYMFETANTTYGSNKILFIDYILYLIGYGDLEIHDHYAKTVFSTIGLFAVTLLSSVFTVNLFELRSKAKLLPKVNIQVKSGTQYISYVELKTFGKDIYNVNATLIAKIDDEIATEKQYIPVVSKKSTKPIKFKLSPGSALYRYLRAVLKGGFEEATLVLTLVYTDIDNGQEYRLCQKFNYTGKKTDFCYFAADGQFDAVNSRKQLENYIKKNTFEINLMKAQAINAEDIRVTNGYISENINLPGNSAFEAFVNMNSNKKYEPKSFAMVCIKDLIDDDWTKFVDMGCHLNFDCKVTGNIALTFEFKYGENGAKVYTEFLRADSEFFRYSLDLSSKDLEQEKLSHIHEICFTVFYENVDPTTPTGTFVIKNCALEVE